LLRSIGEGLIGLAVSTGDDQRGPQGGEEIVSVAVNTLPL
jgi:hypothetical protein